MKWKFKDSCRYFFFSCSMLNMVFSVNYHPRVSVELVFGCADESGLCPLVGRWVLCGMYPMIVWGLKGKVFMR